MPSFLDNLIAIICVALIIYLHKHPEKNPIDEGNPIVYAILLIIAVAVKLGSFAGRVGGS